MSRHRAPIREGGTPSRKRSSSRRAAPAEPRATRSPRFPPKRPEPPPLEGDDVKVVTAGTIVWAIAFVSLLPFYDRLVANDRDWWLWTCLAGLGLGLFGIHLTRRRRARLAAAHTPPAAQEADIPDPRPGTGRRRKPAS